MKRFQPLAAVMFTMLLAACVAGTPTPLSPSASAVPQIVAFEVLPNPVERGDDLRITWQVDGASRATLWPLTYDSRIGRWYRQPDPISTGSNIGEYRQAVPGDARQTLRFELEAKNAAGNRITATSDEIQLVCHALFFKGASPPWCPNAPETTPAAFQAFEGGYMIWRADTGQFYALRQSAPDSPPDWFAFFPADEPVSRDIPPGKFTPGEHFQRAWASLPEHWYSLGGAIGPERMYTLTTQLSLSRDDTLSQNDDLYLTWPTNEIAHLRVYFGAPNHASGPAWSFLGSDRSAAATEAPSVGNPAPATHTAELISEPASITLPAGASGRVVMKMVQCDQQSATFAAPTLPLGVSAEFLTSPTPCEQTMVLHTNVSLSPGEYAIDVTRQSSAGRIASGQLTLQVGACIESQAGEFTTAIQSNLIPVISAGKPSIGHGLLVPLQLGTSFTNCELNEPAL